jgi:hypothetical protein
MALRAFVRSASSMPEDGSIRCGRRRQFRLVGCQRNAAGPLHLHVSRCTVGLAARKAGRLVTATPEQPDARPAPPLLTIPPRSAAVLLEQ